jgi:hypothetical protein
VLELEIRDQLERRHQKSDGKIGFYKSRSYVLRKLKRSTISRFFDGNEVDLFLTGQFQQSITVDVADDKYKIDASDYKKKHLEKMYGEQILDFSKESKENLAEYFLPKIADEIEKEILK